METALFRLAVVLGALIVVVTRHRFHAYTLSGHTGIPHRTGVSVVAGLIIVDMHAPDAGFGVVRARILVVAVERRLNGLLLAWPRDLLACAAQRGQAVVARARIPVITGYGRPDAQTFSTCIILCAHVLVISRTSDRFVFARSFHVADIGRAYVSVVAGWLAGAYVPVVTVLRLWR